MAIDKNTIKSWFQNGLKPAQAQFYAWLDSYWHKDEKIPITAIDDIEDILSEKADAEALTNHVGDANAHAGLFRPAATLFVFVQKGYGNTSLENEIGDIFCGWTNDGTVRYTEAMWLGGALNDSDNFEPLVQTEINIPNIPLLVINSVVGLNYPVVDYTNDSGGLVVVMVSSDGVLFYDYKELQSDIGTQTAPLNDGFRFYRLSLSNDRDIVSNVYENLSYQSPDNPFNFSINLTDRTKFDIVALQDITIILGTIVSSLNNSSDGSLVTNMQSVTYHVGQFFNLYNTENEGQSDAQYQLVNVMTYEYVGTYR